MISGIWANTNYDAQKKGDQSPRDQMLKEIEDKFNSVIDRIWGRKPEMKDEIDMDDPFFAAMKVPDIDFGEDAEEIAKKRELQESLGYVPEYDQM